MERVRTIAEARELQLRLRSRIVHTPPPDFSPHIVAGADVAFDRRRNLCFAAIVVIELETMSTLETATAVEPTAFPYVPGYLSFRELPVLTAAWRGLSVAPDALVVDAHGYAHPRRMGLACHAGLEFDLPTIGCAKSILCGQLQPLGPERGATSRIVDADKTIGWGLRTKSGVRPVYLSVGHRMDLPTAAALVLRLTPAGRYRFPETTRRADRLAGQRKRVD